jgi:hypothetical protein
MGLGPSSTMSELWIFLGGVLGFEFRAGAPPLEPHPSHFCFSCFSGRALCLRPAELCPPAYATLEAGTTAHHHTQLVG